MIVTFVSQCEKRAIARTRKVLDAFANRIGDNTWQTVITEEGLLAVKKLLRQTVTKNTAVSCHWIRSRRRSDLLWIVGNRNRFNSLGHVPVNTTQKSLAAWKTPHLWQNLELIAIASSLAGLFHDFGKANQLFQAKIDPEQNTKTFEPYRHEWVSLRVFEAFVRNKRDVEWLNDLRNFQDIDEQEVMVNLQKDGVDNYMPIPIFEGLTDFAKLIAWLIVSHHRLLVFPFFETKKPTLNSCALMNQWLTEIDVKWNSPSSMDNRHHWTPTEKEKNWHFEHGLPWKSKTWQLKAKEFVKRAQQINHQLLDFKWEKEILSAHLSRLILMHADHHYSAKDVTSKWQDPQYLAFANSDANKQLKQKLDEHNVGVAQTAYFAAHSLPQFLDELPTLGENKILTKGIEGGDAELSFWQDKAFRVSKKIQTQSNANGFFGVNMASTGKGKTFANARIMYALADEQGGCRLSIALGLRTLTTQTGESLRKTLHLDEDEIAIMIGSAAIQKLLQKGNKETGYELEKKLLQNLEQNAFSLRGSESLDDGGESFFIDYLTIEPDGLLKKWFGHDAKIQKILHAPILVSTIDHLMPATEGTRGGRQIAPMLRLLSSDLILDEPDEFGLDDLPALSRLVNWTGLLGGKVLLSSATIPPAMACALFDAYKAGREIYNRSMSGTSEGDKPIVCAWFDEFSAESVECDSMKSYREAHVKYTDSRVEKLKQAEIFHRACIVDIEENGSIVERLSNTIQKTILAAHHQHKVQSLTSEECSFGLVRIANISVLTKLARQLAKSNWPENTCVHLCVYHSRFTLAQRSYIEEILDDVLNRKDPTAIWEKDVVSQAVKQAPSAEHHIFAVLATSVAEVGRDHDYDWAIAEPSSMRSLIQLAGRVQRHRKNVAKVENIFILNMNYRALMGKSPAFCKPGFESENRLLSLDKSMKSILMKGEYQVINAIPSIKMRRPSNELIFTNLVDLEQTAYWERLLGFKQEDKDYAKIWWEQNLSWFGELQRQQPFRRSLRDVALYYRYVDDSRNVYRWHKKQDEYPYQYYEVMSITDADEMEWGCNIRPWFNMNETERYEVLANRLGLTLNKVQEQYGEVRIIERQPEYFYHPFLGVYHQ